MIRWPFERAIAVTLFVASGDRVRFTAASFTCKVNEFGQLIDLAWTAAINAPQQLEYSRVDACQTKACWRRKTHAERA